MFIHLPPSAPLVSTTAIAPGPLGVGVVPAPSARRSPAHGLHGVMMASVESNRCEDEWVGVAMTDGLGGTETNVESDETTRLLDAARRAHEDVAAGRVFRLGEEFLLLLARMAENAGRPLTKAEVRILLEEGLAGGQVERAAGVRLEGGGKLLLACSHHYGD